MLTPSVEDRREDIVDQIHAINPSMQEVTTISSDTLIVGSASEVFLKFGSRKYWVTPIFIEETVKMQLTAFPLSEERRQVVSLCFAPLCITTVGFDTQSAASICKYILLLGGTYSRMMNDAVTLLIARTPLSSKIDEARKLGLPIVTVEWLKNCYSHLKRVELDKYQFSLFENMSFTSSDLTSKQQRELRRNIENNDGIWKDRLDDSIDIVIASSLTMTKKIKIALSAGIPIVKPKWILDSVSMKGRELSKEYVLNWWSNTEEKCELFKGITFSTNDQTLTRAILAHGGSIAYPDKAKFVVVTLGENCSSKSDRFVTDKWVWRCIETQTIVDLNASILFRPLSFKVPVPSFTGCVVSIIGFPDDQRCELSDAVRALGGVPMSRMHKSSKLAISDEINEKTKKASEKFKDTEFIRSLFIRDFLLSGEMPDVKKYSLDVAMKEKLTTLCKFITSVKQENVTSKGSVVLAHLDDESSQSDASEIEADVVYDSRPKYRLDPMTNSSYDPLMSALSSSGV